MRTSSQDDNGSGIRAAEATVPRVSVIIPTYNCAEYVGGAIESVLNQDYDNCEIIVVDDGSEDNTREVVAQFGSQARYIWQENRGLSAARNTGIKAAKGEIIGLLDSDDLYEPDFLSTLVSFLDANPEADAVYCVAQSIDAENNPLPERIGKVVPSDQLYHALLNGGFFPPICLVAYKYCYGLEGHRFDESLRRVEDLDLWLKFAQCYNIIGTDSVLTRYRIMPTGLSSDPSLVLEHRLAVLQRHFGKEAVDDTCWMTVARQAFGRSYLAAAYEYLQLRDVEQAYYHVRKAFETSPELFSELDILYNLGLGDQPRGFRGSFSNLDLEYNARVLLGMLERLFGDPGLSNKHGECRREAYANAYMALGLLSYGARQFPAARRYLLKTIAWNPRYGLKSEILTLIVKSLLPVQLIDGLKRKRRR
jgi:glycosyltransferase involved in cell wall biosynthesis